MNKNETDDSCDTNNSELKFLDFSESLAPYFEQINTLWIKEMFFLEDIDKQVLRDPKTHIIDKGGYVFFVSHPEFGVVGTCALLNTGQGNFELTKMGVLPHLRGAKLGEKLLQFVISRVQTMPIKTLYLLTNKKCEAAIHLYQKNGFVHDADIMTRYGTNYQRCDVAMRYVVAE